MADVKVLRATYDIDKKVLGSGSFGKVFLANDKKNPDFKVAVKVIDKRKLDEDEIINLRNEV